MTRYHATAEGNVPLTPEEEAERDAEEAAHAENKFPSARSAKLSEVNTECDSRMAVLVSGYPEREQQTFPKQEQEARAFIVDATAATPMIDALSLNRGIGKVSLASRIIAKADAFAAYSGMMIGYRQKLEDQITAANTQEQLDAINHTVGWPA
jgi:hypothetical protein